MGLNSAIKRAESVLANAAMFAVGGVAVLLIPVLSAVTIFGTRRSQIRNRAIYEKHGLPMMGQRQLVTALISAFRWPLLAALVAVLAFRLI